MVKARCRRIVPLISTRAELRRDPRNLSTKFFLNQRRDRLRHFDCQFAAEGEVWSLAAFHVFGCGLRECCHDDRKGNCGIAVDVSSMRAASKLAVDQSLVECNCV